MCLIFLPIFNAHAVNNCTGATYYDSTTDTCLNCPSGYDYNTTAGKTDITECQIHCNAGTYVSGYTQLEYITSTGTQYIDSGIYFDIAKDFRVKGMVINPNASQRKVIMGNYQGDGNVVYSLEFGGSANSAAGKFRNYLSSGSSTTNVFASSAQPANTPIFYDSVYNATNHTITNDLTYNGSTTTYNLSTINASGTTTRSLRFFLDYRSNPSAIANPVSIGETEIYKDNILVGHFIPVRRNNDNVLGLYDTVTGQFFTNSGTGSFTGGPDTATTFGGGTCTDVGIGYYAPASTTNYGSVGTRTACPAGTYSSITNAASCTSCAGATYNDETAAASCTACPAGYDYNTTAGKTSVSQCQKQCAGGTYVEKSVPAEYDRLEYIESTGVQCINTGYVLDENDEVEVDYTWTNLSNASDKVIIDGGNVTINLFGTGNNQRWYAKFGHTSYANTGWNESQASGTFTLKKGSFSVNGTKLLSLTFTSMGSATMKIFCRLASGNEIRYPIYAQIGGVRITNNGTMVHNYVPVRRSSDAIVGLYDIVSGVFLTNVNANNFIAGPARNWELGSCTDVGTGYWAAASIVNAGSTSTRTACPAGTYNPITNGTSAAACLDCPVATYNGETAAASCTACPAGYDHNNGTGNTAITDCQIHCNAGTYVVPSMLLLWYTQLEYLESNGSQYINTGITVNNNWGASCDFQYTNPTVSEQILFGVIDPNFTLYRSGTAARFSFAHKNGTGNTCAVTVSTDELLARHVGTINFKNSGNITMDNDIICNIPGATFSKNNFYIFSGNYNGSYNGAAARIYNLQLSEGTTVRHNFIPVRRNSDNVLGMYDTVTNTFFTNSGTGSFTAGPDVYELGQCVDVGVGYYAPASTTNYGSFGTRTACPAGTFTVGYGHGADEANDCGRILHLGDSVIYTRRNKPTTPALNIRMENGDMYYIGLSTTDHTVSRLHFQTGETKYTAFDDSLYYGERDYDTGEKITE